MRNIKFSIIGAGLLLAGMVHACAIKLLPLDAVPAVGETGVVAVQYEPTHRTCAVPVEAMQFQPAGMAILGATGWKEIRPGVFQRKFKVKYEDKSPKLQVVRTCSKGGLNLTLEIK